MNSNIFLFTWKYKRKMINLSSLLKSINPYLFNLYFGSVDIYMILVPFTLLHDPYLSLRSGTPTTDFIISSLAHLKYIILWHYYYPPFPPNLFLYLTFWISWPYLAYPCSNILHVTPLQVVSFLHFKAISHSTALHYTFLLALLPFRLSEKE